MGLSGYTVFISEMEDGKFGVIVPDLDGIGTVGDTNEEAVANAREAVALHLDALRRHGKEIPPPVRYEMVTV